MKKLLRSMLSAAVCAVFALSAAKIDAAAHETGAYLIPVDFSVSTDFQDLTQSWCRDDVALCCQAGLLRGKTADRFDEKGALTNAQITVITARLYEGLTGDSRDLAAADGEAWYSPSYALLKSVMPGVMQQQMVLDSPFMPDRSNHPCSRAAFAELLVGVLKAAEVELPVKNEVAAVPDTASANVRLLYQAGVLAGTDRYGFFHGSSSLTRGQAAAMLARLVDPGARMEVSLEPFDFCEQVFGVSSDTPLLSIDGETVTADACGGALCGFLLREVMANGRAPAEALELAVSDYCREIAAPLALASDWGLSLTQETLDRTWSSAQSMSGYMGRSAESWYHQRCQESLAAQAERACPDGGFQAAVSAKCGALRVEKADAFRALDAETVYQTYSRFL